MIRLEYLDEDQIEFDGGKTHWKTGEKLMSKSVRHRTKRFACLPELENEINLLIHDATTKKPLDHKIWFGTNVTTGKQFLENISKLYESCVKATLTIKIFGPTSTSGSALVAGPVDDINSAIVLKGSFGDVARLWGEDVVTIIHEITHKTAVLGTADVIVEGGEEAYQWRALEMASQNKTDLCLKNAESWAYFLVQGAVYPRVKGLSKSGPQNWKMCHYRKVLGLRNRSRVPSGIFRPGTYK